MAEHRHKWIFLRQEETPTLTWGDRVKEWRIFDVFFCEACLAYRKKHVKTQEPSMTYLGRDTTWQEAGE